MFRWFSKRKKVYPPTLDFSVLKTDIHSHLIPGLDDGFPNMETTSSLIKRMQELGYNYRLTDFQAALGITQLQKNDKGVKRRNELADNYKKAFAGKIKFQSLGQGMLNAHHLFIIEIDKRKELYDFLRSHHISTQIHYIPLHTTPYYQKISLEYGDLSNSEKYYNRCISLPMYPSLSDKDQKFVISKILEFLNE